MYRLIGLLLLGFVSTGMAQRSISGNTITWDYLFRLSQQLSDTAGSSYRLSRVFHLTLSNLSASERQTGHIELKLEGYVGDAPSNLGKSYLGIIANAMAIPSIAVAGGGIYSFTAVPASASISFDLPAGGKKSAEFSAEYLGSNLNYGVGGNAVAIMGSLSLKILIENTDKRALTASLTARNHCYGGCLATTGGSTTNENFMLAGHFNNDILNLDLNSGRPF